MSWAFLLKKIFSYRFTTHSLRDKVTKMHITNKHYDNKISHQRFFHDASNNLRMNFYALRQLWVSPGNWSNRCIDSLQEKSQQQMMTFWEHLIANWGRMERFISCQGTNREWPKAEPLLTWNTTVEVHPHCNVATQCNRMNTDVTSCYWWV